ncbi:hypothetical protein OAX78_04205, partial [Planctomycetota bacterium]|nr:hypothetical protein [Planctomycetota bacterium]
MRVRRLTPPGPGGVALVELVGPGAADLLARTFASRRGLPALNRVALGALRDPAGGDLLDEVLLVRSAEDAFELGCHGGPALVERLVSALVAAGATANLPQHSLEAELAEALARTTTELGAQVV